MSTSSNTNPSEDLMNWWGKAPQGSSEYHPLILHSIDVSSVAKLLYNRRFRETPPFKSVTEKLLEALPPVVSFLGFLHDFGKYSESFQALRPELFKKLRGRSPKKHQKSHKGLGWVLWRAHLSSELTSLLAPENPYLWGNIESFPYLFGQVSFGHHGKPVESGSNPSITLHQEFTEADLEAVGRSFSWGVDYYLKDSLKAIENFGEKEYEQFNYLSWLINGLITLADWLASSEEYLKFLFDYNELEDYAEESAPTRAKRAIEEARLTPLKSPRNSGFSYLFPDFKYPTPLQHWSDEVPLPEGEPGLFILEDSTGAGKTEAALTIAHRLVAAGEAEGFYFGLPTMATSNAMHGRLREVQGNLPLYRKFTGTENKPSLGLSHSRTRQARRLGIIEQPEAKSWLSDNRKLSLLLNMGVGTVDQTLTGILAVYHHTLRLLGLSVKILIVDEVHDYEPYTGRLLERLIEMRASLGLVTILLSATLSDRRRSQLEESFYKGLEDKSCGHVVSDGSSFPQATMITGSGKRTEALQQAGKTKDIRFIHEHVEEKVLDQIEKWAREGRAVAWIRNTIHDARLAHEKLEGRLPGTVALHHSRFTLGDRLENEEALLVSFGKNSSPQQRKGKVVVGTQVLEQSLDVDFDAMVTDLAPMDRILQRVGRLHRHRHRKRNYMAEALIYGPSFDEAPKEDWYKEKFPRAAYVYGKHGLLWKTLQVLIDKERWRIPVENRQLIESVFSLEAEDSIPEQLLTVDFDARGEDKADRSLGSMNAINFERGYGSSTGYLEDTPTRLGREQTRCRLVKKVEGKLVPWDEEAGKWESGDISVPATRVSSPLVGENEEIKRVIERMPGVQNYPPEQGEMLIIPFTREENVWSGSARNDKGREVSLAYSEKKGLEVRLE